MPKNALSLINSLSSSSKPVISPKYKDKNGRVVLGYKMPAKPHYNTYRRDSLKVKLAQRKHFEADNKEFEKWIENMYSKDQNTVKVSTTREWTSLCIQCFLLHMLPNLTRRPSWMSPKDWIENELGLESMDHLYPIINDENAWHMLDSIIFSYGYGPNYFDWTVDKPYRLKGTPTTLYLISMDVGKIAGKESSVVWKIGITKNNIVGSSSKARFSGKIGENVRVIREKLYRDGRDAFMIEQSIIKLSNQETLCDRKNSKSSYDEAMSKESSALKSIDSRTTKTLGTTEWIFPCRTEKEVISIYERMTAYGEFHGDGNISYTPFKRDWEKN